MIAVNILGFDGDLWPISMIRFIRKYTGLGLAEGKACFEEFVEGKVIRLHLQNDSLGEFREEADALGLIYEQLQ